LRPDVGIRLLELTRHRRRFTLDQLAVELRSEPTRLLEKVEQLREDGLLSFNQKQLELDARQRIMLAAQLIHNGRDPLKVSRLLEWQEFENFAVEILDENGFHTAKHLVFKSRVGRREVDVLAWNDTLLLAVDCKHWLRGLIPARMRDAANAQVERAIALAEKPELLIRLGVTRPEGRRIMPVIFSLGEPRQSVANGVPVVTISKLVSFLYGISPVDDKFRSVPVRNLGTQLPLT
jgi:hypothetical protein